MGATGEPYSFEQVDWGAVMSELDWTDEARALLKATGAWEPCDCGACGEAEEDIAKVAAALAAAYARGQADKEREFRIGDLADTLGISNEQAEEWIAAAIRARARASEGGV